MAVKLEALDKAIADIQESIEEEATRRAEVEAQLKRVNEELQILKPGDQRELRKVHLRITA